MRSADVAIVHDWLTGMRGGEKVLEPICRRYPDARLLTLVHVKGSVSPAIERLRPEASFLQRVPRIDRVYRHLLPLMPLALRWKLDGVKLLISSSHCVAKGVEPPPGVPHVCYCHTPMRYAWHMKDAYFSRSRGLKARAIDAILGRLREWDRRTSSRVTHFVANSQTVRRRIREAYGRDSVVIHPPVETRFYTPDPSVRRGDEYLMVSAFAPYKKVEVAIEAFNRLKKPLAIVGKGQQAAKLQALAGPTVRFLGWQCDEAIRELYRTAKAFVFPGEEDFGITPVEANACGLPVIAWGVGGVTETTLPLGRSANPTAVWYDDPSADALIEAVERFEASADRFDPAALRRHALKFDRSRFEREFFGHLDRAQGLGLRAA